MLAGIEPLSGLKASCPSTEPASFSQSSAFWRFLAPLGSANVSDSASKMPLVPGAGPAVVGELLGGVVAVASRP